MYVKAVASTMTICFCFVPLSHHHCNSGPTSLLPSRRVQLPGDCRSTRNGAISPSPLAPGKWYWWHYGISDVTPSPLSSRKLYHGVVQWHENIKAEEEMKKVKNKME